jgi:hypothetical protein
LGRFNFKLTFTNNQIYFYEKNKQLITVLLSSILIIVGALFKNYAFGGGFFYWQSNVINWHVIRVAVDCALYD